MPGSAIEKNWAKFGIKSNCDRPVVVAAAINARKAAKRSDLNALDWLNKFGGRRGVAGVLGMAGGESQADRNYSVANMFKSSQISTN